MNTTKTPAETKPGYTTTTLMHGEVLSAAFVHCHNREPTEGELRRLTLHERFSPSAPHLFMLELIETDAPEDTNPEKEPDDKPAAGDRETCVEISSDHIMWEVHPVRAKEAYGKPTIKLEWGWDAGLTEDELSRIAEDSPRGKGAVWMTCDGARKLCTKLTALLDEIE